MKALNKLFLVLLFFIPSKIFAGKVTGKITDENNQPLPFAIVYVAGTSIGTTSNGEGDYTLELKDSTYEISFRMIGYKLSTKTVSVTGLTNKLDIKLVSESIALKEVNIIAGEDPAYAIIRSAQDKRKFYRDQVQLYGCHAYVKSTQRLQSYPKRLLGQKVDIGAEVDSITKIFYLSESVSEFYFKQPDKVKEKMISSKVSGSPQTYSFNQATDVLISFYDNLVDIEGLTPRGIVSPIAGNSIFYYKFRLEGTFVENGVTINKIAVIPRRISDPVFTGTLYIMNDSWRIYSTDLFITSRQQMELVDTFRIKENFLKVSDDIWMPFSHEITYSFDAFGFKGNGLVIGVFSEYNLHPPVSYRFFDSVVMKVDEEANKKDSAYWEETRPVPLTDQEASDYHRRDSIRVIVESRPYQDSLDKENNKFKVSSVLTGFTIRNSYKNQSTRFIMPLRRTFFNTVEGWNTGMAIEYRKKRGKEDERGFLISPQLRYGFSNKHFNGHVLYRNRYSQKRAGIVELDAGTDVDQINYRKPISELINSLYSMLAEKNYMKIYEKRFVSAMHRSELFNGFTLSIRSEYAHRIALENSSGFKIINVKNRDYTSNDPYNPHTDSLTFPDHNAFTAEASVVYSPGQEYFESPNARYNLGTKWPTFRVKYKRGLNIAGSDIDYDLIQFGIDDEMTFGILGHFKYFISAGNFLSKKKIYSPDYFHFNGNKTWVSDFGIDDFKNLDYYKYSTTGKYIQAHAEHNFGGFVLNKIPFIRKFKLQEVAGVHFLHTEQIDQYYDFSIGVEKLGVFRIELFTSLADKQKGTIGFLFGLKQQFGE